MSLQSSLTLRAASLVKYFIDCTHRIKFYTNYDEYVYIILKIILFHYFAKLLWFFYTVIRKLLSLRLKYFDKIVVICWVASLRTVGFGTGHKRR